MILINKKVKKPYISIITVCKNSSKTLERCIKSVINQNYKNYEHIIIDGGSTDQTLKIILKNKKHLRYALSEKDKNLWHAINKGIKIAKGEVIGILNSDDVYYKNALLITSKYFKKNKIDYLFGSVLKSKIYHGYHPEKIKYKFNIYPSHSIGFFVKKKIHRKIGYYNESLQYMSDYDFFYKLIEKKLKWGCTKKKEVLGKFGEGGISSKINIFQKIFYESKVRIINKQNILVIISLAIVHFINYFIKNVFFIKIKI